ncbi:hypothetical protein CEP54_015273 [Fusarium duplospermum]|uniref:Uncharacterized protein n=1 Tax=Fusarium duplospermum TaxID=1325734 RepID=A0A428NQB7_9HYPO|nr:hypothetical protein CEP54_015273 [Fusarium duplospermum]
MADKTTLGPVVANPPNDAFHDIRASFYSICTKAGVIPNQHALEHLSPFDLRKLLSRVLSVLQTLPLAQGRPNPVGLRIVVGQLQTRVERDLPGTPTGRPFDLDRVKELLKAVLADKPDHGDLWELAVSCSQLPGDEGRDAIPEDARHFFLEQLRTAEEHLHLDVWRRLTKDLFNSLEYPHFDAKASISALLKDNKSRLTLTCAKWAIPVCMVLRQLATEMRMAVDLVESIRWDENVVIDALETLRFSIDDFYGPLARILASYCMEKKDEKYSNSIRLEPPDRLETFGQVVFAAAPATDKVPTATFTELLIRQLVGLQRRSIVTTLGKNELALATNYISTILSALKEKRPKYPLADNSGIPRTLTIVVDQQTGIATTGATQPAYHNDFPWLKTVGKQIHGLRLGGTFRRAIHLCSDNVAQLVKEATSKTDGTEALHLGDYQTVKEEAYRTVEGASTERSSSSIGPAIGGMVLSLDFLGPSDHRAYDASVSILNGFYTAGLMMLRLKPGPRWDN